LGDSKTTRRKIIEEREPGVSAESTTKQIIDLCSDWSGNHEFAWFVSE
jgi:hypothetical protein